MPNKRAKDQVMLTLAVSSELAAALDRGRGRLRGVSRSQFMRDAIAEKLRGMGLLVDDHAVLPNDRVRNPVPVFSPAADAEVTRQSKP